MRAAVPWGRTGGRHRPGGSAGAMGCVTVSILRQSLVPFGPVALHVDAAHNLAPVASGGSGQSGTFRGSVGRGFCRERGPSGALIDRIATGRGLETYTDPEQRVEGGACVAVGSGGRRRRSRSDHSIRRIERRRRRSGVPNSSGQRCRWHFPKPWNTPFAQVFRLENTR